MMQWVSTVLLFSGLLAMTLAVFGLLVVPDYCIKVHVASKGLVMGLGAVIAGAAMSDPEHLAVRSGILLVSLLVTTSVATQAMLRMELHRRQKQTPCPDPARKPSKLSAVVDESGSATTMAHGVNEQRASWH